MGAESGNPLEGTPVQHFFTALIVGHRSGSLAPVDIEHLGSLYTLLASLPSAAPGTRLNERG